MVKEQLGNDSSTPEEWAEGGEDAYEQGILSAGEAKEGMFANIGGVVITEYPEHAEAPSSASEVSQPAQQPARPAKTPRRSGKGRPLTQKELRQRDVRISRDKHIPEEERW